MGKVITSFHVSKPARAGVLLFQLAVEQLASRHPCLGAFATPQIYHALQLPHLALPAITRIPSAGIEERRP